MSAMRICSRIAECSLSYAKIMQTEHNRACSKLLRCSLSYAKIMHLCDPAKSGARNS